MERLDELRDDVLKRRAAGFTLVMADDEGFLWYRPLQQPPAVLQEPEASE